MANSKTVTEQTDDSQIIIDFKVEVRRLFVKVSIAIAVFILGSALAFAIIDFKIHQKTAKNFVVVMRDSILLGDFRKATLQVEGLVNNQATFSRIQFTDLHKKEVFNLGQSQSLGFQFHFTEQVYFDEATRESAGEFVFYYSVSDIVTVLVALLIFGSIAGGWAYKVIKSRLLRQYERDIDMHKNAAIGRIIAHLSHDLRAPLSTFERLLLTPDESMPLMRGAVKDSLNRLNSMIESLRHSEVENLVKKSASRINFAFGRESLQGKAIDHKIELHIPSEDPGEVWIDPTKVERAWINLASNAIEAAKSFVRVEAEKVDASLFIRVIDDGPGVPDDILPRLFQRGITSGKAGGTGLGLAYVRQIMRGHGGDVTYRRENGLTIFECYLPNAVVTNQEDTVQSQSAPVVEKEIKVKRVGICFVPKSMANSVCAELAAKNSAKFSFSTEYEGADIVATNDPDLALTAIEEGKQPLEFTAKMSEAVVLDMLKRRFELV